MTSQHQETPGSGGLVVRGLTVRYGRAITVLRSVDLEVEAGTVVALMGVNGAGKTTLARAVTGMLPFHCGTVVEGDIVWRGRSLRGAQAGQVVRGRRQPDPGGAAGSSPNSPSTRTSRSGG